MAKPAVVLIGADKGGVGKTTVSRTLLDYFLVHKIPTRVFDTEYPKGTLKRFHPEITEVVDITSVPAQMKIFDRIYSSGTQITLLDIRAGTLSSTLHTLRDIGFLEMARRNQIIFALFHILGPSIASLDEIAETSKILIEAQYFLVKNFINNRILRLGPSHLQFLFQKSPSRGRDHDSEAERNGLRTSRACIGAVCYFRCQDPQAGIKLVRAQGLRPPLARQCIRGI